MAVPNVFDNFERIRPAQGMAGSFNQYDVTVAASQTINYGDVVALSSGTVQQAIALPGSNNTGTASGGNLATYGIALASIVMPASGNEAVTNRSTIPVAVFDGNLEVLFRIYNAVAGNATQANVTLGTAYQFQRWRGANSSTWWYSLLTTTTNGEMLVVEKPPVSASGDTYGVVAVRAVTANVQG